MGSRKTADFFAREAKKLGYAARSALKLTEIQDRFRVMRAGDAVLDLGCHPGAWTQVASERGAGSIVGVDLTTTRSDALGPRVDPRRTTLTVADVFDLDPPALRALCGSSGASPASRSRPFAAVLSDMAPSTSGDGVKDAALSYELAEQAVRLALGARALAVLDEDDDDRRGHLEDGDGHLEEDGDADDPGVLRKGGSLVVKLLEGPGGGRDDLARVCKPQFESVRWFRPRATRRESREVFLVAKGRRGFANDAARDDSTPSYDDDDSNDDDSNDGRRRGWCAQRVSIILSLRELCSRREAEALIARGVVVVVAGGGGGDSPVGDSPVGDAPVGDRFTGRFVVGAGGRAELDARIELVAPPHRANGGAGAAEFNRAVRQSRGLSIAVALNKPAGYVSNLPGPGESDAIELLGLGVRESERGAGGLSVCGRLDKSSRGLLVLTGDGTLARALVAGGGAPVPKTYLVETDRAATERDVRALNGPLSFGPDEEAPLRPMRVRQLAPTLLEFVLREGKKRQIRRVCEGVGLGVVDLLRVRLGRSDLGSLPEGSWRTMSKIESDELRALRLGRRCF